MQAPIPGRQINPLCLFVANLFWYGYCLILLQLCFQFVRNPGDDQLIVGFIVANLPAQQLGIKREAESLASPGIAYQLGQLAAFRDMGVLMS